MNFVDMIFYYANATPEKPAVILADRIVTYRMMAAGIRSVESVLRDKGLAAGQIVGVKIDSPARHLIVTCALYRLGVVLVSVIGKMDVSETGVKLQVMITDGGPVSWTGTTYVASDDWFGQEPGHRASGRIGFPNPDALCRIAFSSGTTATPRAIGMSAQVFEDRIERHRCTLSIAAWDRMLILPTLNSVFFSAALALANGRTIVFAFSAPEALQLINLFAIDLVVANPQQLKDMVAAHRTNPISHPVTQTDQVRRRIACARTRFGGACPLLQQDSMRVQLDGIGSDRLWPRRSVARRAGRGRISGTVGRARSDR